MTVLEPVIEYVQGLTRNQVTLTQLVEGTDRPRKPILRVMDRLVREGYMEEIQDDKIQSWLWRVWPGPPESNLENYKKAGC